MSTRTSAKEPSTGVTVCILAGGRGTRLRAVVSNRPKPLAEVAGRPFVTRLLEQVVRAGFGPIVLCTGYMASMVEEALGSEYRGVDLRYSPEPEALGTAGAVRLALPWIATERVLVLNGDSFCGVDLAAQLAAHVSAGALATLALVEVPDAGRYGRVQLGREGTIERFEEKVPGAGRGLINAGVYLMDRSVIEGVPEGRAVSMEREVFPALAGDSLKGFVTDGRFLDIGTPESLAAAADFFAGSDG